MLHLAESSSQPLTHFLRFVVERPHTPFVGDAPIFVDDVETLWPCGIRIVRRIVHFIDAEWRRELESLGEIVGDGHPLRERFRLCVANVIFFFFVAFHLPLIGRMSFAHVDR